MTIKEETLKYIQEDNDSEVLSILETRNLYNKLDDNLAHSTIDSESLRPEGRSFFCFS
jgi:hypothetical protein